MFSILRRYGLFLLVLLLLCLNIYIFRLDWQNSQRVLTFAMLDVGQGDALLVESPSGTQVLIDSGPPGRIIGALQKIMSPFDRHIDAMIITNPDQDHIGGFKDVLEVYQTDLVLEPGTVTDSKTYQNLKQEIKNKNVPHILARAGMRLHLGSGAYLDILFPDRDVTLFSTNDGSIVAKLSYGETSIMLTGDATTPTEEIILKRYSRQVLDSDILKVGHHGSRTSTGASFVQAVTPDYALVSLGKDNNYGHPHQSTLEMLKRIGAEIIRTDLSGTIIVKSDGEKEVFSFHQ